MTNKPPLRRFRIRRIDLIYALIFTLIVGLSWLPRAGSAAQDSPEATQLKQKAQHAYVEGRYADAVAANLEIAEKHPDSEARRYAVQILGAIYEENVIDLKKAVEWDREFLQKYADPRQAPFYEGKISNLEKLLPQEPAFKTYQAIRSANYSDEILVEKYEALLKGHPDFLLRDNVEIELGNAYGRMDRREQSYLAFQSIVSRGGEDAVPPKERAVYEAARRYWQMTWTWAWVAWGFVIALWVVVLLMKPWKRLTWASSRKFLLWPVLWVLLTVAIMPIFNSLETGGYSMPIPRITVFILSGLNLTILFWLLLLTRGEFWQTRRFALVLLSPVLTLVMTAAVFYLVVVYHPYGPYSMDVFAVKLAYWKGQVMRHGIRYVFNM